VDPVCCRKKGITFVAIDRNRPLDEQGPFDIVLDKVSSVRPFAFDFFFFSASYRFSCGYFEFFLLIFQPYI